MKRFKGLVKGELTKRDFTIYEASFLGWTLTPVGYEVLDQLEVGETTIDDDGDTWERVE